MRILKVKDWLNFGHMIMVSENGGPIHVFRVPENIKGVEDIYKSESYSDFRRKYYERKRIEESVSDKILGKQKSMFVSYGKAIEPPSILDYLTENFKEIPHNELEEFFKR